MNHLRPPLQLPSVIDFNEYSQDWETYLQNISKTFERYKKHNLKQLKEQETYNKSENKSRWILCNDNWELCEGKECFLKEECIKQRENTGIDLSRNEHYKFKFERNIVLC